MKRYRITYSTYIEVEANNVVEARELSCDEDEQLCINLEEISIEEIN